MSNWPIPTFEPLVTINPWSEESIGDAITSAGGSAISQAASTAWPTANLALYVPFQVRKPIVVVKMFCYNGAAVAGNVDVGIYSEYGTRIVSIGSTAQAGLSAIQEFDIADTLLGTGIFYMAIALDDATATATIRRGTMAANAIPAITGMAQEQLASVTLPATATFASIAGNYIPVFGLTVRTLI